MHCKIMATKGRTVKKQFSYQKKFSRSKASVSSLPNEVLLHIFEHLSVRDLCTCALVCRKWQELSSINSLWKRKYESIMCKTKKPSVLECSHWKSYLLQRGIKQRNAFVDSWLEKYEKQLGFSKTLRLKELHSSLVIQMVNERGETLHTSGVRLPEELHHNDTQFTVSASLSKKKTNPLPPLYNIHGLRVWLAVPMFRERDLSWRSSPRHYIPLRQIDVNTSSFKTCNCVPRTNSGGGDSVGRTPDRLVEMHVCIAGFLVAVWPTTPSDLGFITFTYLTMDIIQVFSRLRDFHKSLDQPPSSRPSTSSSTSSASTVWYSKSPLPPQEPLIPQTVDLFDMVGDLLINNFNGDVIFSNVWRSFDCKLDGLDEYRAVLLRSERREDHLPFDDNTTRMKWKVQSISSEVQDTVVVKMVVESRRKEHIWSISRPVVLQPLSLNSAVQYDYEGEYLIFNTGDAIADLRGIVLRPVDSSEPLILVDLSWTLRDIRRKR